VRSVCFVQFGGDDSVKWSMANTQRSVPNILVTGECLYLHFSNNLRITTHCLNWFKRRSSR
jgi:hypothetical protein